MVQFTEIPQEVLSHIFSFISEIDDLKSLLLTCQCYYELITYYHNWTGITIRLNYENLCYSSYQYHNFCTNLKNVKLHIESNMNIDLRSLYFIEKLYISCDESVRKPKIQPPFSNILKKITFDSMCSINIRIWSSCLEKIKDLTIIKKYIPYIHLYAQPTKLELNKIKNMNCGDVYKFNNIEELKIIGDFQYPMTFTKLFSTTIKKIELYACYINNYHILSNIKELIIIEHVISLENDDIKNLNTKKIKYTSCEFLDTLHPQVIQMGLSNGFYISDNHHADIHKTTFINN